MGFWISLAVLIVAVLAGIAYATLRGIQLYREARRVGDALSVRMERIDRAVRRIERHMAQADAASARLRAAGERLARSRAQLDVQLQAVREARMLIRRVFWFVPGV
jgi:Tfp pilus assembly protein PilE